MVISKHAAALPEFEKTIDAAIAEARAGNVDHRRIARCLREHADDIHPMWACTAAIV
jgi:hypothetical protein